MPRAPWRYEDHNVSTFTQARGAAEAVELLRVKKIPVPFVARLFVVSVVMGFRAAFYIRTSSDVHGKKASTSKAMYGIGNFIFFLKILRYGYVIESKDVPEASKK